MRAVLGPALGLAVVSGNRDHLLVVCAIAGSRSTKPERDTDIPKASPSDAIRNRFRLGSGPRHRRAKRHRVVPGYPHELARAWWPLVDKNLTLGTRAGGPLGVESGCGAVPVGRACLLPPLSSGGALVARP